MSIAGAIVLFVVGLALVLFYLLFVAGGYVPLV